MANTTPNRNSRLKLSNTAKKFCQNEKTAEVEAISTPIQNRQLQIDKDYSPIFLSCTQERENVDVAWDWNSPQSKTYYPRKQKRTHKPPSPQFPIKKQQPINNRTFDKLNEELKAFRDQVQKSTKAENVLKFDDNELELATNSNNKYDDLFSDDSIENHLVQFSQEIEENINKLDITKTKASPRNLLTKSFSSDFLGATIVESPVKTASKSPFNFKSKLQELKNETIANDSFDRALEEFKDEDYNLLTQVINLPNCNTTQIKKEYPVLTPTQKVVENKLENIEAKKSDIIKIKEPVQGGSKSILNNNSLLKMKTKSFSFGDHYNTTRSKSNLNVIDAKVLEEIERKRLLALAKLKAKKKPIEHSDSDTSPIKCSPEEIELKRQQALAKRDAKRKQDIIERNRQEALKRLELNRKKRAASSQASSRH